MRAPLSLRAGAIVLAALVPLLAAGQTTAPGSARPGTLPVPSGTTTQSQDTTNAAPAGTAVLRGRVLSADTGAPVRRAQVRLGNFGSAVLGTLTGTDDQGRFEYTGIAAGRYSLTADKAGHVKLSYGQRRYIDPARPIDVTDGQTLNALDIALPRGATIVARVMDDHGEPFAGARLRLDQYKFIDGARQLTSAFPNETSGTDSNDQGMVRFTGLPPGDYVISATPLATRPLAVATNNSGRVFATTYYPGTTAPAEAERVKVAIGQELNLAFSFVPVRTARVSGVARSASGGIPRGLLRLKPRGINAPLGSVGTTIRPDGSFAFDNVVPGNYTLWTAPPAQEFGAAPVVVNGDTDQVVITTSPGTTVRGRLVFEDSPQARNARRDRLALWKVNIGESGVNWPPGLFRRLNDDTFELTGISGRGVLRVADALTGRSGWFLKAVRSGGRDITDTSMDFASGEINDVEVVLTARPSEVSGIVVDARNTPVADFVAVVFPENPDLRTLQSRYIATGRPDQDGKFRIIGLPPGRYMATVVPALEEGEEQDSAFLERLEGRATRFVLTESDNATVSLRLVP